jgi:hypothetical protein
MVKYSLCKFHRKKQELLQKRKQNRDTHNPRTGLAIYQSQNSDWLFAWFQQPVHWIFI